MTLALQPVSDVKYEGHDERVERKYETCDHRHAIQVLLHHGRASSRRSEAAAEHVRQTSAPTRVDEHQADHTDAQADLQDPEYCLNDAFHEGDSTGNGPVGTYQPDSRTSRQSVTSRKAVQYTTRNRRLDLCVLSGGSIRQDPHRKDCHTAPIW